MESNTLTTLPTVTLNGVDIDMGQFEGDDVDTDDTSDSMEELEMTEHERLNDFESLCPRTPARSRPLFDKEEDLFLFARLYHADGQEIEVGIQAHIDGFLLQEGLWTCLRHELFTSIVSCLFTTDVASNCALRTKETNQLFPVRNLFMSFSAVDAWTEEDVGLVQMDLNGNATTPFCKISRYPGTATPAAELGMDLLGAAPGPSLPTVRRFERLQFSQASVGIGGWWRPYKRCFQILVELWAEVEGDKQEEALYIKVAHQASANIVVQGWPLRSQ